MGESRTLRWGTGIEQVDLGGEARKTVYGNRDGEPVARVREHTRDVGTGGRAGAGEEPVSSEPPDIQTRLTLVVPPGDGRRSPTAVPSEGRGTWLGFISMSRASRAPGKRLGGSSLEGEHSPSGGAAQTSAGPGQAARWLRGIGLNCVLENISGALRVPVLVSNCFLENVSSPRLFLLS